MYPQAALGVSSATVIGIADAGAKGKKKDGKDDISIEEQIRKMGMAAPPPALVWLGFGVACVGGWFDRGV